MPVKHSIIIPHHNREEHLLVCLGSLYAAMGDGSYEIIVVGTLPAALPPSLDKAPIVFVAARPFSTAELGPNEPRPFHKTKLLNLGIAHAGGETLTFLDSDAVAGPRFAENFARLDNDSLTKLAYRVRYAPYTEWPNDWAIRFKDYDCVGLACFPLAFEAYGSADHDGREGIDRISDVRMACMNAGSAEEVAKIAQRFVFGNSQFSIRRDKLGDLRFDERYFGRGWEDVDMNRRIADHYGDAYRCGIVSDGPHALFHIKHPHAAGYEAGRFNERNRRLYYGDSCTWYACPDVETAERVRSQVEPHCHVVWEPNDRWELSAAIAGLDTIIRVGGVEEAWCA